MVASCAAAAMIDAAVAAPAPLALSEAQRLAIDRSPQMAAYDSTIAAARGVAGAAQQLPEVALSLGVVQQLASPEARQALAERYALEADRAAAQKAAVRVDIARETALAWLDCYYVERMTRVAADQLKAAQVELDLSERMYWANQSSQAEFYGVRSTLAVFEDKTGELQHRSQAARIALKRWVGDAGEAPLGALPDIDRIVLKVPALEGDLARHPEVALLQRQEDLAGSDVRVAQAERLSSREIALMLAKRDEARAARDEKLRAEVAQIRIMIEQWQHTRDRRDRYVREIVPFAHERTQATLVAYRGGKAALADVLAACRSEIEAQMQAVETEREAARLWAQITFSIPDTVPTVARTASREETVQ
jgi:outer membrane protein TolC